MTDVRLRQDIRDTLTGLVAGPLLDGVTQLFHTLGYRSERRIDLDDDGAQAFVHAYDREGRLNPDNAMLSQWRTVQMVFQLSGTELRRGSQQLPLFADASFEQQIYQSFLFFAIELGGASYTRAQLATITREVNKLFTMPVSVVFRYGGQLTITIVTHRPNKRDDQRDVLEKVSLIRDVQLDAPHRAHIEILKDLAVPSLSADYLIAGFDDLQRVWARTLDISELNRRFYKEIADWYFWAVRNVSFPEIPNEQPDVRNATRVIRMLTRLIFVWFLKEKGLVADDLFDQARLRDMLVSLDVDESSYYQAILQNLFFATLNTEMRNPALPRRFRGRNISGGRDQHRMVHNVYRYERMFRDPQAALALFTNIPFLNGGLFECLDRVDEQDREVRIDSFSDHPKNPLSVPNRLFFSAKQAVDLNAVYGTRGRRYEVRGLIDILQDYKFTIVENTPIEEDVALDPELLGQVFENLLAAYNPETETTARKETGSFYTPRGIVEYMVDESLLLYFADHMTRAARLVDFGPHPPAPSPAAVEEGAGGEILEDRLRQLLTYTDEPPRFSEAEVRVLITAIDALKIIDPACGSGAFPMGALQKLVYVLGKLDPANERWREQQRQRALRETEATFRIGDKDERERRLIDINETFEHNSSEYGRKLFLIENSIYGVDIQPIAAQIAKLRCFIALIVDQRIVDQRDNRGIRPLPNLETRFVAADALNRVIWQGTLRSDDVIAKERELAEVRSCHFNARTPATKKKYRDEDQRLRDELGELLRRGIPGATADLLARWNPYDQNDHARFFDPEWMFGVTTGFDIVIANPPYVRQEQIKQLKPALERQYSSYTGVADLYIYFYERAVQLLNHGGVLTFISSNKYFRAGYGQKLRRFLATNMSIHQLIDFGDAPVFKAIAYPSIIVAQKYTPPAGQELLALNWNPAARLADFAQVIEDARRAATERTPAAPLILQKALTPDGWRLEGAATQKLLEKLRHGGKPLGEYISGRFYYGIKTGLNEAFVVNRATRDALIAEHPSSEELLKPFLRGRDVKRWRVEFAEQYLIKIESSENKKHLWSGKSDVDAEQIFAKTYPAIHKWFKPVKAELVKRLDQGKYYWELRSCAYWQEFKQPKIIYPDIYEHQSFDYDTNGMFTGNTIYFIPTPQKWLAGLLNSQAIEWFYSLISNRIRGGYLRAFSDYMRQIPIPAASSSSAIEALVTQILAAKAANPAADVRVQEREIDERVYALYGLRPDEIRMIEESVRGERKEGAG